MTRNSNSRTNPSQKPNTNAEGLIDEATDAEGVDTLLPETEAESRVAEAPENEAATKRPDNSQPQ